MKKTIFLLLIVLAGTRGYSTVSLPKIFGDNMVVQRDKIIPVWGWGAPGEKVSIRLNAQQKATVTGTDGKWLIRLNAEKAGGPYLLIIAGTNVITFSNVLVGEVWICSGQSNMEMPVKGWGKVNNYEAELAAANYPQIRQIKVPNTVSVLPLPDISSGEWKICNPENTENFSAAAYFFAREIYNRIKVPIGLINTSWGGTMVETWTSREAFEHTGEFKDMIATMPSFNLDSFSKVQRESMLKKIEALQGAPVTGDTSANWKEASDEIAWPQMSLPALWEQNNLNGLDGIVWFRRKFTVLAGDVDKEAILELGMIDDNDITYVNGVPVGSTFSYNTKRRYVIPAGVLKEGSNSLAVRVEDTGGGGGVYGDPGNMKITVNEHTESLAGNWFYRVAAIVQNNAVGPNDYPTLLFNAMINPLIPYAMRGVIWYQGETNAGRAFQYRQAFPLMITDWRNKWGAGDFPFYFVQLASFNAGNGNSINGSSWAELREAQTLTLSLPNTGMAVTTDIGEAKDIHPKNKQDVGKRLAAIALKKVYGKKIVAGGPEYRSMKTMGKQIIISFNNSGSGLIIKGSSSDLQGFEIAGPDKVFHAAKGSAKNDQVILSADSVQNPVAVRFAWADDAGTANLFNKEGFPAVPFRTDQWTGLTETAKFEITR